MRSSNRTRWKGTFLCLARMIVFAASSQRRTACCKSQSNDFMPDSTTSRPSRIMIATRNSPADSTRRLDGLSGRSEGSPVGPKRRPKSRLGASPMRSRRREVGSPQARSHPFSGVRIATISISRARAARHIEGRFAAAPLDGGRSPPTRAGRCWSAENNDTRRRASTQLARHAR